LKTKTLTLSILLLLSHLVSLAQTYTVIYVNGDVTNQGKTITIGQHLAGTQHLSASDKNAFVCFLHPKLGKLGLNFAAGKPVPVKDGKEKHSELYELTIEDYITKYDTRKVAAVRGLDYVSFFRSFPGDSLHRLLLIENDTIPLITGQQVTLRPGDRFSACSYAGKDSVCRELPMIDTSFLIISAAAFSPDKRGMVQWKLRLSFTDSGRGQTLSFRPDVYHSYMMQRRELILLIGAFKDAFTESYAGDRQKIREELYNYLTDFYGKFHTETVDKIWDTVAADR